MTRVLRRHGVGMQSKKFKLRRSMRRSNNFRQQAILYKLTRAAVTSAALAN
jgi:hypothetical protein